MNKTPAQILGSLGGQATAKKKDHMKNIANGRWAKHRKREEVIDRLLKKAEELRAMPINDPRIAKVSQERDALLQALDSMKK